jgi:putative flavoprotein involved in K+ transport
MLADSPFGRATARHRGRDTVEWLYGYGFFDQRPQDLAGRAVTSAPQPLLTSGGRGASLQQLVRSWARMTGRLIAVHGNVLRFDDSATANVAAADRTPPMCGARSTDSSHPRPARSR